MEDKILLIFLCTTTRKTEVARIIQNFLVFVFQISFMITIFSWVRSLWGRFFIGLKALISFWLSQSAGQADFWLLFSWPGTEKQDLLGMNIARCSIIHLKSTDHLDQLIIEINRSKDLHDTAPPPTSSPFPILIVQWRSSGCFLRLIYCLFVLSSFWPINDP